MEVKRQKNGRMEVKREKMDRCVDEWMAVKR